MTELGELEAQAGEFEKRNVRIVAASVEGPEEARQTQADYPHLTVVADAEHHLTDALEVIHPKAGPGGQDVAAPTTFLVDGQGTVRWLFRPDRVITRLSPAQLLAAVDEHLPIR